MATIIAGGFETIVQAEEAKRLLSQAGVNSEYLCEFRVNPPGMHDTTVIGGDRDESPGAHEADKGATKGARKAAKGTAAYKVAKKTPVVKRIPIIAGIGVAAAVVAAKLRSSGDDSSAPSAA